MSNTLKEGYVVTLKSGGPKMVIERIDSDGDTICTWFNGFESRRDSFKLNSLEEFKPSSASF